MTTKPKTARVAAPSITARKKSKLEIKPRGPRSSPLRGLFLPAGAVLVLIAGVVALVVPMNRRATKRTNEMRASRALSHLGLAEAMFQERHPTQNAPWGESATLPQLLDAGYANTAEVGLGTKDGYVFSIQPVAGARGWWAMARPEYPGVTGERVFYTNHGLNVVSAEILEGEEPALPDQATGAAPAKASSEAFASR